MNKFTGQLLFRTLDLMKKMFDHNLKKLSINLHIIKLARWYQTVSIRNQVNQLWGGKQRCHRAENIDVFKTRVPGCATPIYMYVRFLSLLRVSHPHQNPTSFSLCFSSSREQHLSHKRRPYPPARFSNPPSTPRRANMAALLVDRYARFRCIQY